MLTSLRVKFIGWNRRGFISDRCGEHAIAPTDGRLATPASEGVVGKSENLMQHVL
jgi:hypothetical protein